MSIREVRPGEENLPNCKVCGAMVQGRKCLSCGTALAQPVRQIQLTVRCVEQPDKHAKILRFPPKTRRKDIERLAGLLDGSSPFYIHKPGPNSPIGKCATCGGKLTTTVEEVENAKSEK